MFSFPVHAQQTAGTVELASGQEVSSDQFAAALESAMESNGIAGISFALVNDNEIVLEGSFGIADRSSGAEVTGTTLFEFASMSKPAFGALVVDLAAEGVLDLDTPLAEYLPHPDLSDDPRAAMMTARHILTHQSGLPNWRSDNPEDTLDFAFDPGTGYRYSGEGYEYLADVVMHLLATDDRGLDQTFMERFAKPSNALDTRFVQDSERVARKAIGYADGTPRKGNIDYSDDGFGAAYSIHSTASDYARLLIGLMDGSTLNEEERATFFAPQNAAIAEDDPERALGFVDYALGFAIFDLPIGRIYAHGGNNEGFSGSSAIVPEKGWAFVVVSNEDQANQFVLQTLSAALGLASLEQP